MMALDSFPRGGRHENVSAYARYVGARSSPQSSELHLWVPHREPKHGLLQCLRELCGKKLHGRRTGRDALLQTRLSRNAHRITVQNFASNQERSGRMCNQGVAGFQPHKELVVQAARCSVCWRLLPLSEFHLTKHTNCPGPPGPDPGESTIMRSIRKSAFP